MVFNININNGPGPFTVVNGPGQFTNVNGARVFQQPPRAEARANDDIIPPDKVIAIMGLTGAGKSTFIDIAAGSNTVVVDHALNSYSKEFKAVEIDYQGQRVVLVDTPGFGDTDRSDTEVLKIIANWLKATYVRSLESPDTTPRIVGADQSPNLAGSCGVRRRISQDH